MRSYEVVLKVRDINRVVIGGRLDRAGFVNELDCYLVREGKILTQHRVIVGVGEWSQTQLKIVRDAWVDGETVFVKVLVTPLVWTVDGGNTWSSVAINELLNWYAE